MISCNFTILPHSLSLFCGQIHLKRKQTRGDWKKRRSRVIDNTLKRKMTHVEGRKEISVKEQDEEGNRKCEDNKRKNSMSE